LEKIFAFFERSANIDCWMAISIQFVVKVRPNLFPNLGPWVHLLLSKEVYGSSPFSSPP
jgi:hypothetical protein